MNRYEMLYIIDAGASDESREAVISKFENLVTTSGGTVEKIHKWGMNKLAYTIKFKDEGYYVLMTFSADGALLKEIDRVAGITDEVIRRMVTRC